MCQLIILQRDQRRDDDGRPRHPLLVPRHPALPSGDKLRAERAGRSRAVQPISRPFAVSLTSMLPRVALEYGHT